MSFSFFPLSLSLQVDHLTKKPKDGERCLREILSVLLENDISPFEVTQSGLVPSLLMFLTKPQLEGHEDIARESRVRTFLQVFMGCPRNQDSEDGPDSEATGNRRICMPPFFVLPFFFILYSLSLIHI